VKKIRGLAAVIITYNEEKNIEKCLRSVSFCEEIVVLDSGSSDKTLELAKPLATLVTVRPWKGYSDQKNYANQLTSCEWVLSIDADEEVSPELKLEIEKLFVTTPQANAYSMPRKTIHFGRWIRFGGWYPNRLVRLFKKNEGMWQGDDVHEFWKSNTSAGELKHDLIHYSFEDLFDQVERNNHYSTLGAQRLVKTGAQFSVFRLLGKTLSKFLETYLLKMGFRDGYPGFIIAVSAAYSVFLKWAKLWELEKSEKA
jgi:glycosyltransferase involved in cell wall biosynthesis